MANWLNSGKPTGPAWICSIHHDINFVFGIGKWYNAAPVVAYWAADQWIHTEGLSHHRIHLTYIYILLGPI